MKSKHSSNWFDILPMVIEAGLTRILLYGPPDTGKTTTASLIRAHLEHKVAIAGVIENRPMHPVFRVQCSRQQGIEDILGSYVLRSGATEFIPGPIAQAMTTGGTLILDEFDFRNPAHDSIWHAVLDDPKIAEVRLPDGTVIKPAPGFIAIATTNATPSAFSPALQRRFELKLFCGASHPEALNAIKGPLASLVSNWQKSVVAPAVKVEMTVSALATYARLEKHFGDQEFAAALVFKANSNEFLSALANNIKA